MTAKREIKVGDIVIVDEKYRNGNYKAIVVWVGKYSAVIKVDDEQWSIMKNRLKLIL